MAYDQIHIVDATSQMIEIALRSSTTGQLLTGKAYGDMTIKYQREGVASATTVGVVTATKGAYTSGGFVETDIAGLYQFGIPTGALATGAKAVTLTFSCTGAIDVVKRLVLIGADLRNAASLGLSNLDAAVSTRSTYAGSDTSGVTTLLARIIGTLATGTHNPQTGDAFARLGAPAGASVSADVAAVKSQTSAIETDTQDLQTQIGTAGAGLTAADDAVIVAIAALNNLSSAQAQSAATAALNAYDPPTNAEMEARTLPSASYFDPAADVVAHVTLVDTTTTNTDMVAEAPSAAVNADAVWDELLAAHSGAGSAGLALATASSGGVDPSVLADAVWDEALSGHSTAGTAGKKLTDLTNADLSGVATAAALADVPTVAEFEARSLPSADYTVVGDLPSVPSTADIKTALEADGGKLDHLWEMTEDDSGVRRLTTNALEQAPAGSGTGLTAQETADAVNNLAPAGASGAAGSIRAQLVDAAKTGADGDTLKTLSDQIDGVQAGSGLTAQETANAVHNLAPVGVAAVGSIGANLDNILNGLTGVGLIPLVYTVTEPGGVVPISGVTVELYTEEACLNCVRRGLTNSFGVVTFWMSTAGTYWIKSAKDGYSFELDSETVAV